MTTTGGAAFTTTHRVIDGIHRDTTHAGAATEPAAATCFTEALVVVFVISDFANCCAAAGVEEANFTRWHFDGGTIAIDGNELCGLAGGAGDLRATTWMQLNSVNFGRRRNNRERQAEAHAELDAVVGADKCVASDYTTRCEDVALFTIGIREECEISRSIWIVLDGLHLCGDVELFATEVDDAIDALMASTTTTRSDTTVAITALLIVYACDETALWLFLGDVLLVPCKETLAGSQRSGIYEWHVIGSVEVLRA